jgi:hypothetical protein
MWSRGIAITEPALTNNCPIIEKPVAALTKPSQLLPFLPLFPLLSGNMKKRVWLTYLNIGLKAVLKTTAMKFRIKPER